MKKTVHNFPVLFMLLVFAQMIISNYFNFSMFVTLSILPAIVICIPVSVSTLVCMTIGFATGLAVDVMADGVIGLNALALVPVALFRRMFIRIFLGEDIINRNEDFTFRKNGIAKVSLVMFCSIVLFFGIYVIADCAGMRPAWFCTVKIAASTLVSYIVSLLAVSILTSKDRQ